MVTWLAKLGHNGTLLWEINLCQTHSVLHDSRLAKPTYPPAHPHRQANNDGWYCDPGNQWNSNRSTDQCSKLPEDLLLAAPRFLTPKRTTGRAEKNKQNNIVNTSISERYPSDGQYWHWEKGASIKVGHKLQLICNRYPKQAEHVHCTCGMFHQSL